MNHQDSELVDRYVQSKHDDSDTDIDALLDEVDDDYMTKHREQRIEELMKQFKQVDAAAHSSNGELVTSTNEKEVIDIAASSDKCLVHFYQPSFTKCQQMSKLLARFANTHLDVKCVQIDASEAPFLVAKLGVKVLPLVVCYINGKESGRLVGFDTGSGETYEDFERYMLANGVISRKSVARVSKQKQVDEDEESDLDI